jgi:fumarate reductase subunit C
MIGEPYPRQHSSTWFVKRWPYRLFMLRELSSVFLAAYMVLLLVLVMKVHDGRHPFTSFQHTLHSPGWLTFNSVVLLFALLHTVTWFQAVPKALPLRRGENKVSPVLLIGMHYGLMLVLSAAVLVVALT